MPTKPRVFITRQIFSEAIDLIAREARVEVWPEEGPPPPGALRGKITQMQGVLTTLMDRIDASVLDAAPYLKVVSQMAVGLDNIDVAEATRRRILVGHTPGVLAKATADLAFGLLLAAARRVSESESWVRRGNWKLAFHPLHWLGADVHDSTLGIIGLGQVGQEVAKRGRGFDMRIQYASRSRKPDFETQHGLSHCSLPELLETSDFVSLHVALTPETYHFIGEKELRQMKPSAVLINVARGPIVDPPALYTALKERWIRAAALDVTQPEPLPPGDPLLSLDNLVITPHIGSASQGSRRAMSMLAARNLIAGLNRQRLECCANPEAY